MDRIRRGCILFISTCCLFIALDASIVLASERLSVKTVVANLRNGAGTKYKVLWQVEKYHPFLVINKKQDWYEVKDFEGDTAWIHRTLLGNTDTVISIKSQCNVRTKPDTSSDIILRVERGVPFKVLAHQGDWIKIEHADGEVGWIFKNLVW
ncbi:SH3 domain-containing protein [uncultured Desulfobacter sp.]|uniref:SH3 domain-containing protein n=1 Tax=uncultured Desulfobacter sp. TaxID=240139 RepID=UPI002AAA863D|nr:SH3 domain-containing protein [uncultured Desulfobacter sp.]